MKIPKIKNKWSISLLSIVIIVVDLYVFYYLKYNNQGISFRQFRLFYPGNLLNFIFCLVLILSILIYTTRKKVKFSPKLLIFNTALLTILLIAAEIVAGLKLSFPNIYFLGHPLRDTIKAFFFSLYQFSEFLFISILWITLLGRKELLILRALVNSVLVTVFLLVYAFFYLNSGNKNEFRENTGKSGKFVGVVLGAAVWPHNQPSPSLAARTKKAAELYQMGVLSKIQLTGSHAPGEMSESEVAYNLLLRLNINPGDIWLEKKTTSTIEQIRYIRRDLVKTKNIKNILIISDGYHLKRVNEICAFFNVKAKVAASGLKFSLDSNIYNKLRESIALLVFWLFAI